MISRTEHPLGNDVYDSQTFGLRRSAPPHYWKPYSLRSKHVQITLIIASVSPATRFKLISLPRDFRIRRDQYITNNRTCNDHTRTIAIRSLSHGIPNRTSFERTYHPSKSRDPGTQTSHTRDYRAQCRAKLCCRPGGQIKKCHP